MRTSFLTAIAILLFGVLNANATTICKTISDTSTAGLGPSQAIAKTGTNASLQVHIVSGSGTVGSYQVEESNSNLQTGWVDLGSAVSTATISKITTASSQFVRFSIDTLPGTGVTVRVCLYADGVQEQ